MGECQQIKSSLVLRFPLSVLDYSQAIENWGWRRPRIEVSIFSNYLPETKSTDLESTDAIFLDLSSQEADVAALPQLTGSNALAFTLSFTLIVTQ